MVSSFTSALSSPLLQVLYHSLPVMLESCSEEKVCSSEGESEGVGERNIVIDQAVEFLQALLDLLTELQLHLGVSVWVKHTW